ncbi:hypothetical protein MLD38_012030 [Melastoma candidum]|uniref:Uncharacterized protein n=1 Tax=Melastoma candidum TaxID=119954 RepID=A0ACB9R6R4_9MYRT|nr:hypothetical protein MLD38_012030 [Melastoma candidum]
MGWALGKCCLCHSKSSDSGEFHGVGTSERLTESILVPSHNFRLDYSMLTRRGYYPDSLDKENQDSYCIKTQLQGNQNFHFFGVFDGHGVFGAQCSNFVKERLLEKLGSDPAPVHDPMSVYHAAFQATNQELHNNSEIDDSMSGKTAITVLVVGDNLFVANDQTPLRRDEYERVKLYGARLLSVDQVEGLKDPDIQTWGDEETEGNDPPQLWVQDGMYPGTAFTRNIGDSTAEKIGVVANPDVSEVHLTPDHLFYVIANPRDACTAIASESCRLWPEHENRKDDITIIIGHIKGLSYAGVYVMDEKSGNTIVSASFRTGKCSCSSSVTSALEVYRSIRSKYADTDSIGCSQHAISNSRNAAIVMPSPLQAPHLGCSMVADLQNAIKKHSMAKRPFLEFYFWVFVFGVELRIEILLSTVSLVCSGRKLSYVFRNFCSEL